MTEDVSTTIAERKSTHGSYVDVARAYDDLMKVLWSRDRWDELSPVQRLSLEMIMHKTARIITGNPNFADHWLDIEGYAKLARTL